jgi:hypothetical protein
MGMWPPAGLDSPDRKTRPADYGSLHSPLGQIKSIAAPFFLRQFFPLPVFRHHLVHFVPKRTSDQLSSARANVTHCRRMRSDSPAGARGKPVRRSSMPQRDRLTV